MKTLLLLAARYDGKPIIPLSTVCKDYFSHLNETQFLRKVGNGEIRIPVVRAEQSQKSAKGVHLEDLARYLDERTAIARREVADAIGQ